MRVQASSASSEQPEPFRAIRMQECPDCKGAAAFKSCHGCANFIRATTKYEDPSYQCAIKQVILVMAGRDAGPHHNVVAAPRRTRGARHPYSHESELVSERGTADVSSHRGIHPCADEPNRMSVAPILQAFSCFIVAF